VRELQRFADGADRPFLHLVDGGLSDNLGVRGAIEVLETLEALHLAGRPTPFDDVRRIVVVVVNSQSERHRDWSRRSKPPGPIDVVLQASAVPIHDYSSEAVELLKNMQARWSLMRELRHSPSFQPERDPALAARLGTPSIDLHAVDVSFAALADAQERAYLNELPTSFALSPDAVDRLRRAARTLVHESAEFRRALADAGARIVPATPAP
jgi:NTE family protein